MTDLNRPPRIWRCEEWAIDLECIKAIRYPTPRGEDGDYLVFTDQDVEAIELDEADGESLAAAWIAYFTPPNLESLR